MAMKTALLCIKTDNLEERLRHSLCEMGYQVEALKTPQCVLKALKDGPRDALVSELPRGSFAFLVQAAFRMHPGMPIHLIDGGSVFCFYPLAHQPAALIEAITTAGVRISAGLMRHITDRVVPIPGADAVLI
jgi:hypothetical protein